MKNIIILLAITLCVNLQSYSQSMYGDKVKADVKMDYVYTIEDAISKAQVENKPIFFNCFADWAIPCHSMNKLVFSDKKFCDWMNKNFVNLFIDVSLPENEHIVKRYNITFFAHYVILDKNGELIHRIVGGKPVDSFKDAVALSLSPKTSLKGVSEAYKNGDRSKALINAYAKALLLANDNDKFDKIKDEYLDIINHKELTTKDNFDIFASINKDVNSKWFDFLLENKSLFSKNNGHDKIDKYISSMFIRYFYPFALSDFEYNKSKLFDVYRKIFKANISPKNRKEVELYYFLAKYRGDKKIDKFLDLAIDNIPNMHNLMQTSMDLSLKDLSNMTTHQKDRVVKYLKNKSATLNGSTKKQYQNAIKEMNKPKAGIKFDESSFKDILAKARDENKLIFLDAYTSWCAPCKLMSNEVFTQKKVGDFFNKYFINTKFDMEKGEGIKIARKYNIKAYPTMLILDSDGKVIHKILGSVDADYLIRKVKNESKL